MKKLMPLTAFAVAISLGTGAWAQTSSAPASSTQTGSTQPSALSSWKTWFQHVKEGLADSAVRGHYQSGRRVTAVAAVRGQEQDSVDPNKPQWETQTKEQRQAAKKE